MTAATARPWTAAELARVRAEYPTTPAEDLARELGRSVEALRHAAKKAGVRGGRSWSAAQDDVLRARWGKVRTWELARELGRSPSALKQRAGRLGPDSERYYTPADLALGRELYPTHTAAQIAARLHGTPRTALAIYKLAQKLGLRKCPHWSPEDMERVRAAVAAGGTDAAVAARLGLTREQVTHVRNRLGLPRNEADVLAARRRGVRTQFARLGIGTAGQLRALAYRRFAAANGWPEDLRPREVQVLNVLAEHGPKTRLELSELIGMRTDRIGGNGRPALLTGNGPGGTYTASLIRRGLVVRQTRSATGRGRGKNRLPDPYVLTPAAIATREECLERLERNAGAPAEGADAGRGAGADPAPVRRGGVGRKAPGGRVQRGEGAGRRGPDPGPDGEGQGG